MRDRCTGSSQTLLPFPLEETQTSNRGSSLGGPLWRKDPQLKPSPNPKEK